MAIGKHCAVRSQLNIIIMQGQIQARIYTDNRRPNKKTTKRSKLISQKGPNKSNQMSLTSQVIN